MYIIGMYNIYISNSKSQTKGNFQVDFYSNPLYFEPFSKLGVQQLYMWNSINNISSSWGNNTLYIKTSTALDAWNATTNPFDNQKRQLISGTIYKLTLDDGQYDIDALNVAVSKLIGDWNWTTNSFNTYSTRKVIFFDDETTGKIGIDIQNGADVLFLKTDDHTKTIAYLLGYNLSKISFDATDTTHTDYYSVSKYRSGSIKSELGPQKADINNGVLEVHLKLTNNIVFAGYDNLSGNTDTIFAFAFSKAPGLLEAFVPQNITWFNIMATNISLDRLTFKFTDQYGRDLNENVADSCNIVLVIDTPAKER